VPEMSAGQRASGGWTQTRKRLALPWDDYPPVPMPDQSRYGPRGTTDSPRFHADGRTPWPRESDEKGSK
jgi:hypothetical protein